MHYELSLFYFEHILLKSSNKTHFKSSKQFTLWPLTYQVSRDWYSWLQYKNTHESTSHYISKQNSNLYWFHTNMRCVLSMVQFYMVHVTNRIWTPSAFFTSKLYTALTFILGPALVSLCIDIYIYRNFITRKDFKKS